jgi:hypothetical protein
MKAFKSLLLLVMFSSILVACNAQTENNNNTAAIEKAEKVDVYYFHFSRRCATCNAVEEVSRTAIEEMYGDNVSFAAYNLDEDEGAAKAGQVEISGQTLIVVSGKSKFDITNPGFLNARTNPDKLKQIIKETIDPLL